jgi:hypothetical protein
LPGGLGAPATTTPVAVTEFDEGENGPGPIAFTARTWMRYAVPADSPVTVPVVAGAVTVVVPATVVVFPTSARTV